ncbi:hypothetical protein NQ318_009317 [Aromia moschata]|uniref:Uncharacterized protein n=1 Tax=Aromia moschata TaxID=1265417 RepID=A0AAV8XEK9_9CUCU|nr:hypothetical protein NQ318_009317 [Aromia moschata]
MGHVRKVPSKRQAVVDDDTKLNLLLALEENPITPARQLARDSNLNHKTTENKALRLKEGVTIASYADDTVPAGPGVPLALQSFQTTDGRLTWNYFDEAGYISRGALRQGEDPYIRNRFNQEASDSLPSNREIPDTRNAIGNVQRPKTFSAPDGPQRQKRLKKIGKLIREDRRLSIRGHTEVTGIDKECVQHEQILLDTVTLKGTRFESVEAFKEEVTEVLYQLIEADFQHCFQQWKSRMERYISSEESAEMTQPHGIPTHTIST